MQCNMLRFTYIQECYRSNEQFIDFHKDFIDKLNMQEVANEFVSKNGCHIHVIGPFAMIFLMIMVNVLLEVYFILVEQIVVQFFSCDITLSNNTPFLALPF